MYHASQTVNLGRGIRTALQDSLPHRENTLTQTQNIPELLYTADVTNIMNSLPLFFLFLVDWANYCLLTPLSRSELGSSTAPACSRCEMTSLTR